MERPDGVRRVLTVPWARVVEDVPSYGDRVRARIATTVIEVDAVGISSRDPHRFPHQDLRRPIYPLDSETTRPSEA